MKTNTLPVAEKANTRKVTDVTKNNFGHFQLSLKKEETELINVEPHKRLCFQKSKS
jgi:hypothetical protein